MSRHLTGNEKVNIIRLFTEELESMKSIAKRYKKSRQCIYKFLIKSGIDPNQYSKMEVSCTTCGTIITRHRSRIKKQKHHFCCFECHDAYLIAGNGNPYIQNRQGQRIGRRVVSCFFDLQENNIVHHEDRNTLNNIPNNLKVFATQGDHLRYHRGFEVEPIWDGSILSAEIKFKMPSI